MYKNYQDYKVKYPSTNFAGCKLFSYAIGSGADDIVLGFPLKYLSLTNIGDIVFDNYLYTDTFVYTKSSSSSTVNVSNGYVRQYSDRTNFIKEIGWQTAVAKSIIRYDKFDVKVAPTRWGNCQSKRFLEDLTNPEDKLLATKFLQGNLNKQPDLFIQISIPNEFQPIGKYNIGITAGIETTLPSGAFIEGKCVGAAFAFPASAADLYKSSASAIFLLIIWPCSYILPSCN